MRIHRFVHVRFWDALQSVRLSQKRSPLLLVLAMVGMLATSAWAEETPAAAADPSAAAAQAMSMPKDDERKKWISTTTANFEKIDPVKAADFAFELFKISNCAEELKGIASRCGAKDPETAKAWAEQQPNTKVRCCGECGVRATFISYIAGAWAEIRPLHNPTPDDFTIASAVIDWILVPADWRILSKNVVRSDASDHYALFLAVAHP